LSIRIKLPRKPTNASPIRNNTAFIVHRTLLARSEPAELATQSRLVRAIAQEKGRTIPGGIALKDLRA